jgi:hypothetical protein
MIAPQAKRITESLLPLRVRQNARTMDLKIGGEGSTYELRAGDVLLLTELVPELDILFRSVDEGLHAIPSK